jgi:hypothetical protein
MVAALSTRMTVTLAAEASLPTDLANAVAPVALSKALVWLTGTGADQADRIFADARSVTASTTDTLDVATGGGLTDVLGAALALVKVKAIVLVNTHATQGLTLQRPAANGVPWLTAAGDAIPVPAGGFVALGAGASAGLAAVTAATADLIDVVNGAGATGTYQIVIIGTSA